MQSQPRFNKKRRTDERRREQAAAVPDDVFRGGTPSVATRRHGLSQPWLLGTGRLWIAARTDGRTLRP